MKVTDELGDHARGHRYAVQFLCKVQVGHFTASASWYGTLVGHYAMQHKQKMALQQVREHE